MFGNCAQTKQLCHTGVALNMKFSLAFTEAYREQFIEITGGNVQMFNNGSNVGAAIICEKGVGRPTQTYLILTTYSVSIVDDICKACKLT